MNDILSNGIVQKVVGGILVVFIIWLISKVRQWQTEKKIVTFLEKSENETGYIFRSTNSISSELNISESNINNICSSSLKIVRNKKEKQSWKLRK